jgi:hypothetical protein
LKTGLNWIPRIRAPVALIERSVFRSSMVNRSRKAPSESYRYSSVSRVLVHSEQEGLPREEFQPCRPRSLS